MDDLAAWTHVALDWLDFQAASLPNMVFFQEINDFLTDEIQEYADNLLGGAAEVAGAAALSLLTLWILIQGYRIVTGQSRAPMMALVVSSLRAVLIIGLATSAAAGAGSLYGALTDGMTDTVHAVMTGHAESGMDQDIDKTLAVMQTALTVIDSVDTGGDAITDKTKDKALWFAGIGLGGPAIIAAGALLLNKIAMVLILGLGPLFILCLLFESTKPMFAAWLYYGLGTLCSLALLSVMVTLALDMVIAVGLAFWASNWLNGGQDSLLSMAMQQGGLGVLLSTLIISAPPMVAMFFRGSMGQFTAFVMFGQGQQAPMTTQSHPHVVRDQTTSTPTHAFRDISTPSQQADEIKRAPEVAEGSFLERYPNALASFDGHGGSGDPLPTSLHATAQATKIGFTEASRKFSEGDIRVTGTSEVLKDTSIERLRALSARDLNVLEDMVRNSGDVELAARLKDVEIELNLDDWSEKYAGTQNAYAYAQAHYVGTRVELNAGAVAKADTMHYRVSQLAHELYHLTTRNNAEKKNSVGSPTDPIEVKARRFTADFMNSYWKTNYEFRN